MGVGRFLKWVSNRFQATVINDIYLEMVFFSGVAAMVAAVSKFTHHHLGISNQLLTVLGTVLGLVVSFRTSSAYERYQEGRKLWTAITLSSRNLAGLIWIHVSNDRPVKDVVTGPDAPNRNRKLEVIIEKKSMINLVQAFSVSVKHFLRGESGIYYEDLFPLVSLLPRYASYAGVPETECLPVWQCQNLPRRKTEAASAMSSKRDVSDAESGSFESEYELRPARNPPHSLLSKLFHPSRDDLLHLKVKHRVAEGNIPLEITLFLHSYFGFIMKTAPLAPSLAASYLTHLASLQDSVANLERVRNTPIPFAYQAHLRMCMWLYLFALPFEIYTAYGWLTIPATAFATFLMIGFLEIGKEIEDPFGYDLNDLDVDAFCGAIARELHEITAHPAPDPATYVFRAANVPFAPSDRRTADAILADVQHDYHDEETGAGSVHRTLLRNWREVNALTLK